MKEDFFIGDSKIDHEKSKLTNEEVQKIAAEKRRWGVLEGAGEKFTHTLEANDYVFIPELTVGIKYPTVDDWVEIRGVKSKHIRFYPAFIKDTKTQARLFCKAKVADKLDHNPGLKTEADVISALPADIATPKFIKYVPADEKSGQLELLVLEEVKFDEAHVLPVDKWKPEYVEDALRQIEHLKEIPLAKMPGLSQEPPKKIHELLETAKLHTSGDYTARAQEILTNPKIDLSPAFVHSDMWLKNILISTDVKNPKTMLIDWALAGAGYRGEDVARLWWDLWNNESLRDSVPRFYLKDIKNQNGTSRQNCLRVGVLFASLRDIVDYIEELPTLTEPAHSQVLNKIKQLQEKALMMLDYIQKEE